MSGYEITLSITALCPCCGKALPSNSYLTESKPSAHPLDRDNPYERKDRRVFITPCADCFQPKDEAITKTNAAPRFPEVFCSSCGQGFGPGNEGFSHCADHASLRATS